MKIFTILIALNFSITLNAQQQDFDDITNLPGWVMDNQSNPLGVSGWLQGSPLFFSAQQGVDNAYISAHLTNVEGSGTICNFLILPDTAAGILSFWTRSKVDQGGVLIYPDRLTVRASPSGNITTGDCDNGFGDFTQELLTINPTLTQSDYPDGYPLTNWTNFQLQIPNNSRVAFIYYVTDAGSLATNANYIGIDTVKWGDATDFIFANNFE